MRLSKASPQNIHLIFEGLGLLRQAGQILVAVQQVGHLALQDFPAHAHVVSAVLQPEERTQREQGEIQHNYRNNVVRKEKENYVN